MAAGNLQLQFEQGADFRRSFELKDSTGSLQDTTNYTIRMEIQESETSSTNLIKVSNDGALDNTAGTSVTLGGSDGTFTITIPKSVYNTFTWNSAKYAIFVKAPGGSAIWVKLLKGDITLDKWVEG